MTSGGYLTPLVLILATVLICDAVSNIYLGKLLLKQSRLLQQACQTLYAAINCVAALAEKLSNTPTKE